MRLLLLVVFPALRCAALSTARPSRLRRAWRAVSRRRPPAPVAPQEPASAAAPVSTLARTTSLSDAFWEALDGTRVDESSAARNKRVAFRVRPAERWVVVAVDGAGVARVSFDDAGAVDGAGAARVSVDDAGAADARVTYKNEDVFEALMDERYGSAAAVALGRLRVSGDLGAASATEPLFDEAERKLRATRAADADAAARLAARRDAAAAALEKRLDAAGKRPRLGRLATRFAGTDQQLGAALLALGSVAYVAYCAAVCAASDPADALANDCYLASAVLWLLGAAALIQGSFPERVLALAERAENDAADSTRIDALAPWDRYVADSAILAGAWGLGLGAPTFLAGAAAAVDAHPGEIIPLLYALAGAYIVFATFVMVLGALPENLAANGGAGSDMLRRFVASDSPHVANDLLAGSWAFALFMVACLAFGVVDLAVEPSPLTASFAASQVPFAVGALALAKATYPENLNGATLSGASPASVTDEMILRGHLGFEAALEDELAGS